MEQKLNIAEILRNKPEDTKLYSPIFGECVFRYIKDETNDICVKTQYDEIRFFNFEGLYNAGENVCYSHLKKCEIGLNLPGKEVMY